MPLLRIRNLQTNFETDRGLVRAVDGVSFELAEGEILGLVGESGSGKSVTALSIMRLVQKARCTVRADEMTLDGVDLLALDEAAMRDVRGAKIGMIFQDPMGSLNPVLTVGRQLTEILRRHMKMGRAEARRRAIELLETVGISIPEKRLSSYPHQLSGGMRQRVMIAIALSCRPKLLIADEATTALDVTIQAQITELIKKLTRELGTAVIWISHDLGVVAGMCDRVNVMYAGRIVEAGDVGEVFSRPSHGYTLGLLGSTPRIDGASDRLVPIDGMPPDMTQPASLCAFLPRCRVTVPSCQGTMPIARHFGGSHYATCLADLPAHGMGGTA